MDLSTWSDAAPWRGAAPAALARRAAFAPFHTVSIRPDADLFATPQAIRVVLDVPGVRPEDLQVELDEAVLSVRAERPTRGHVVARAWTLPEDVDPGGVVARLDAGVLTIEVARRPRPAPRRVPVVARAAGTSPAGGVWRRLRDGWRRFAEGLRRAFA